jgi:hypothetical protein
VTPHQHGGGSQPPRVARLATVGAAGRRYIVYVTSAEGVDALLRRVTRH